VRQPNLRRVLDEKNSFIMRDTPGEDIEQRRFPRPGTATDQDVFTLKDKVDETIG
jgi:hypothetical protein